MIKERQLSQNGVTYAKPLITKPRLNSSFGSPRNRILKPSGIAISALVQQSTWQTFLKEINIAITNPVLFLIQPHCSCSLLPVKVFTFVQLFRTPFFLLEGMLPNSNRFLLKKTLNFLHMPQFVLHNHYIPIKSQTCQPSGCWIGLKRFRMSLPKMFHLGIWIMLSWGQWGPKDSRKAFYLPLNCLKELTITRDNVKSMGLEWYAGTAS